MTSPRPIHALTFDAHDPARLADFWGALLDWRPAGDDPHGPALVPGDDTGFRLRFLAGARPKTVQNQVHFDLTSAGPDGQRHTVDRALELGARHIDVGQRPEEGHVVLADPEGNEFCVTEAGNSFLADCGFLGALSCDGSQAVGYFWSRALGWPLVWDQDQETAIRSPHGGPKVTWGGPPVAPKTGRNRLHFDLLPPPGATVQDEIDRLTGLGAQRLDDAGGHPGAVVMADVDGNEFCLLPPQ